MKEVKKGAAEHSTVRQPGRKDMDQLSVAVLLHYHLLAVPHHLAELLHTVQLQAFEGMFVWMCH